MTDPGTRSNAPAVRDAGKRVALYAAVYTFLVAISALYWFPPLPRSVGGWLLFLLFAPPLYLLGEWIGERVARPWWESSLYGKAIKAALLILAVLVLIVIRVLFLGA
jgi:hypothetical protein